MEMMIMPLELRSPDERPSTILGQLGAAGLALTLVAGTRDDFCGEHALREWHARIGARATLHIVDGADHFFSSPVWLREAVKTVADALAGPAGSSL
mmetsp:Transcript_124027/g.396548  ORF Transcript_124027/g.396548 Transcript_124027/m.396548 type:complete len:96 (+) Transcript_124027:443-730(+)